MLDLLRFFLFVASLAAFIKITHYMYRYYIAHKAHAKRLQQEIALPDANVLEQAKWNPVDTELTQLSQAELAQVIREKLKPMQSSDE